MDQSEPLHQQLRDEWLNVEAARNKFNELQTQLMPQIVQIEGRVDKINVRPATGAEVANMAATGQWKPGDPLPMVNDIVPWSQLHELKQQETALLQAGAHRT
jgi:hypothetical protein